LDASSAALERSTAIVCRNLLGEPSASLSLGDFDIRRTIGRGGHGVVYEAFDRVQHEAVALKLLSGRGPAALYRLKREFRALAEIRHPNLVALHQLAVHGGDAYFTMDLVAGHDFVRRAGDVAGSGGDLVLHLRTGLLQLCEGVHALHRAGKLHRDLKPSNILVTDAGRVVILDFGLVDDTDAVGSDAAGTPAYMAPEQARGQACESSDWYSVGRVLEQALSALRRQSLGAAALLTADASLDALARRLLDPEPCERPPFEEIVATLTGHPHAAARSSTRRLQPDFVGRNAELAQLQDAYGRSRKRPVVMLVTGESGIGKTALIRHFTETLAHNEASAETFPRRPIVLRGRCYERESVPYKALDSTVDELSRVLCSLAPEQALWAAELDRAALLALFPVLGRVPWLTGDSASLVHVHPTDLRVRSFAALRTLLARLAALQPLVVCIDDLQWSDADSGSLLGALLCEEDSPSILVLATTRSDLRSPSPAIEQLTRIAATSPRPLAIEPLRLGTLTPAESNRLARALFSESCSPASTQPGARVQEPEHVAAESGGNPFFLLELARWLGDSSCAHGLDRHAWSLGSLTKRRLRDLSAPNRAVLELVAAAGRPLPTRVIGRAAGIGRSCGVHVKELRAASLLRAALSDSEEWLELEHDRIAEAVLEGAPQCARVALHRSLVQALLAEQDDESEALLEQYIGAGLTDEASHCAQRLAHAACAALAFSRAARLYEQSLALRTWSPQQRASLHAEHARALEYSGRGLDAAAAYQSAAALSSDACVATQLEQRAADNLMRAGRHAEGEALLRRGYRSLGLHWPETRAGVLVSLVALLLPAWRRRMSLQPRLERDQAIGQVRADFLARAGRGLESYDTLRAVHNALLCFSEAEQLSDPAWRARVKSSRGLMRCFSARSRSYARGIAAIQQGCATAAALGDITAQGDLERQLALAHYIGGRPGAALAAALRSEACLRQLPEWIWDLHAVRGLIGSALFDLGRLREARQCLQTVAHAARLHGDLATTVWVHAQPHQLAVLFATGERAQVEAAIERMAELRRQHPRYAMIGWIHAVCLVEHALYWGDPEAALRVLQRERSALFGTLLPFLRHHSRVLHARACLSAATVCRPGPRRLCLLGRACLEAALLCRSHSAYDQGRGHLLFAAMAMLREERGRASRRLDLASALFESSEARLLLEATRYCRGALLGGEEGSLLKQSVRVNLEHEGVVAVDHYVGWVAFGLRDLVAGDT
jgi:serine/threonine protein kinase/tetratricopeptide (TPR) repeat protein